VALLYPQVLVIFKVWNTVPSCRFRQNLVGGTLTLNNALSTLLDLLKDGLSVLVELELGDDNVAGVDAKRDTLARGLLAGYSLDVDHVFETVD
jgi:hypothetical protein